MLYRYYSRLGEADLILAHYEMYDMMMIIINNNNNNI